MKKRGFAALFRWFSDRLSACLLISLAGHVSLVFLLGMPHRSLEKPNWQGAMHVRFAAGPSAGRSTVLAPPPLPRVIPAKRQRIEPPSITVEDTVSTVVKDTVGTAVSRASPEPSPSLAASGMTNPFRPRRDDGTSFAAANAAAARQASLQAGYHGALSARFGSLVQRVAAEIRSDVRCDAMPDGRLECVPALPPPTAAAVAELFSVLAAAHANGVAPRPFQTQTPSGARLDIHW